ncbi:MAG: FHA domain-containing protein, partial [Pyrinomonadaceae bacterium]
SNTIWIGREIACEIRFDPGDVMVSRKHASIRFEGGNFVLEDNKSFNGTLVNDQRISAPTPLYDGDRIELGIGGPLLRLVAPGRVAPQGADLAGRRAISINHLSGISASAIPVSSKTMAFTADRAADLLSSVKESAEPQLLMSLAFGDRRDLTIGRDESSDIKLDGLQISNKHARLLNSGNEIAVEDLNSTNGVYINGMRVSRQSVRPEDSVQIGTFLIRVDSAGNIGVFDTRSKTRIDAVGLTKDVRNRFGGGKIRLLDGISLSIQPNEFVGILGASGSGKSTLIDALNGVRPAHPGNVLINNLDLYRHFDSLKQSIGYVPQDDIIHRELSVYRTLYYVARLRLSRDVSKKEINQTINEVLDVTGLAERRNVRIDQLSGGQRKRVSMAVELITRPSVIFLDEPTSGLDPATEEKIMKLFRQIAESGRTVIMTTHAMENVKLFDKIVILMRGKLAFYGKPEEALKHLGASSYKDIFDKLEESVANISQQGDANRTQQIEQAAETWKAKFLQTAQYRQYVNDPLKQLGTLEPAKRKKKRRLGIFGSIRQFFTLSRRYFEVLLKDKLNLFILLAQAPIIALLTFFVMGSTK